MLNLFNNIGNWFHRFRRSTKLNKVFTPSSTPTFTYVNRLSIEHDIGNYLAMPGVQLVVYGLAGSGKSTVVTHVLRQAERQYIVTQCTETSTIDSLIKEAFSKLPPRFTKSRHAVRWNRVAAALNPTDDGDCLPLHFTPQRLGEILGNANIVWIIEQFHLVAESERTYMLEILKVFSDLAWIHGNPQIIVLGNCHTTLELFYFNTNMGNRIGEVEVPYMNRLELQTLICQGEQALQMSIPGEVRTGLAACSNGLPRVCHQLALILCLQNNIWKAKKRKHTIPADTMKALLSLYLYYYHNSFKATFFKSLDYPQGYNIPAVMETIGKAVHRGISFDAIRQSESCRGMTAAELRHDLAALTGTSCGNTLYFDTCVDLYMYSDPYLAAYAGMYFYVQNNYREEKNNQKKVVSGLAEDKQFEKMCKRLNSFQPAP